MLQREWGAEGKSAILNGARIMFPYIDIGPIHLGTFGLLLWLAAVVATVGLHRNFVRNGVDADALSVVAFVVIAGVIGAKTGHELQNVAHLKYAHRRWARRGGSIRWMWRWSFCTGFRRDSRGSAECWRELQC